jgi:hypothetical protein
MINITYIYLVENCFNNLNKVYIGKTTDLSNRKSKHKKVYGKEIKFTIIDEVNSLDRKDWRPIETMWIQSFIGWGFDVLNTQKEGGSGPSFRTEEWKKLQSKKITGRKHTEETKQKMKKNQPKGPKHSQAHIDKWSKPILQFDKYGNFIREFPSLLSAASSLNKSRPFIWNCLKGIVKTAGGYIWRYKKD